MELLAGARVPATERFGERKMLERNRTKESARVRQTGEDGAGLRIPLSRVVDPLKIVDGLPKKRTLTPEGTPPIAPQATH